MEWTSFAVADGSVGGWVHGDGAPLVLVLHGGPGLSDYTEDLAREVHAAHGGAGRVVRYQQRGLAPSATDGPITIAQLVADLFGVLDHFGARSAMLVGHSWGGHLAMHAAIADPSRVSSLVIVDTLGAIGDGGAGTMGAVITERIGPEAVARVEQIEALERSNEHEYAMFALAWPGYFADPASAPPAPDVTLDFRLFDALEAEAMQLLAEGVLERAIPELTTPSVHVIGRASPIDPAAGRATAALFSGAIVEELETGHLPWIEEPGSVTRAVQRLLSSTKAGRPATS